MFKYILSSETNYLLLICDDAGPGYARDMKWIPVYLDHIDSLSEEVVIIDPRVDQTEIAKIEQLLAGHPDTKFFLRIADPSYEDYKDHFYYNFLSKASLYKNAYLLSTYEPRGIVSEIKKKYSHRFIHLPYAYSKSKEVNPAQQRKNKIVLSGSLNENIYPYRTAIWRKVTRSPTRFLFFTVLKHPGYIDLGPNRNHAHSFVKNKFITFLSHSKYMLMCPSDYGIELLKFHECAYAGCIPVGQAPDSYPPEIRDLFLRLRPDHLLSDVLRIIFRAHDNNSVSIFRTYLHRTHNADTLNKTFKHFIQTSEEPVN